MKKRIEENKKIFLGIVIGLIVSVSVVSAATILYGSDEVSFNNTTSHLKNSNNQITLEEAIDALYDEVYSYGCPADRNKVTISAAGYRCSHKTYAMTVGYKCVRASWLHKEKCTRTSGYCYADGYYVGGSMNTDMITYGNLGISGGNLEVGDAFDCDVNGNGYIDVDEDGYSTERFYYVSSRWTPGTDVSNAAFDTSTAVLIYYSNTYNGSASYSGVEYAIKTDVQAEYPGATISYYVNNYGPVSARKHLPTTSMWGNVTLNTTTRAIIACNDADCSNPSTSTGNGNTVQDFSYAGYASRFVAIPEIKKAGCDTLSGITGLGTAGALKACNFLMERSLYKGGGPTVAGPWLENPGIGQANAYYVSSYNSYLFSNNTDNASAGARPVIEVPVSQILK